MGADLKASVNKGVSGCMLPLFNTASDALPRALPPRPTPDQTTLAARHGGLVACGCSGSTR